MKKLVFVFSAIALMGLFGSCGNSANVGGSADSTAVDSVDTVVVDSIVADSTVCPD